MDEENGNEVTVGDLPAGNLNISQVKIFISKPLMHDVLVLNVSYLDIYCCNCWFMIFLQEQIENKMNEEQQSNGNVNAILSSIEGKEELAGDGQFLKDPPTA